MNWGAANQVVFEAGKEHTHIIDRKSASRDTFKMLGISFDTKLTMDKACCEIAATGHNRLHNLLRGERFFDNAVRVRLYTTHSWPMFEYATPAIYHAPGFFTHHIDGVQDRILQ